MLKNIRLHIEADELKQTKIEESMSQHVKTMLTKNVAAFNKNIPSLVSHIRSKANSHISIFCNKTNEFNIVDYGSGRTFYGLRPQQEIKDQFTLLSQQACYVNLVRPQSVTSWDKKAFHKSQSLTEIVDVHHSAHTQSFPKHIGTLVVLGLGLGHHIRLLLEHYSIGNLIIYEPEHRYFQCSNMVEDWSRIFSLAHENSTKIFMQLGKDGRDLIANIEELQAYENIEDFFIYKHYNHPVFDEIDFDCRTKSWEDIKQSGFSLYHTQHQHSSEYLPYWTAHTNINQFQALEPEHSERFGKNLAAFKKYFPDIVKEFESYQTQAWIPVETPSGDVNVVKKDALLSWYGNEPKQECDIHFEDYSSFPNKDDLVLGYNGKKLKHYSHYKFVASTDSFLAESTSYSGKLPDTIKSIILFGIGVGYQLESLFTSHKVEKLFLCEPNRDFFYASFFAIDWDAILTRVDEEKGSIYINIGDDGTNLFRDLLNQFYSIGPYVLANTYFYQGYYNANLLSAVTQLREQLQIVVAVGEYYDHAKFGIAHTTEMIARGAPLLLNNSSQFLSKSEKDVPVFIVGNGPSLDASIEVIKEWQGSAIVVSCGTALMPLHQHGIVPDFHAEIEQNRSTFDWCFRVGDFDYLKQISLISCNGIHPDTCELFKDVFIAFKDGESSTVSAMKLLGEGKYSELKFAFPTVSNFSINLFTLMGFTQLYLFGVDLGFVDPAKHHSKASGYFGEDGNELFDYQDENNTSLVVPGNFTKTVFTKHEFKVSKEIIEESLRSAKIDCYNCSNGAKILGTTPLKLEHVVVTATNSDKANALEVIKTRSFVAATDAQTYFDDFQKQYNPERLDFECSVFVEKSKEDFSSLSEVERYIVNQKEMLFASYQQAGSLLFFLMYGTVNYVNSVLSKLLYSDDSEEKQLLAINEVRKNWHTFLQRISLEKDLLFLNYDKSSALGRGRVDLMLQVNDWKLNVYSNLEDALVPLFNLDPFPWYQQYAVQHTHIDELDTSSAIPNRETSVIALLVNHQHDVDRYIGKLNRLALGQNVKICFFGNQLWSFDFSALTHKHALTYQQDFVDSEKRFALAAQGKLGFNLVHEIPMFVLRHVAPPNFDTLIIRKLRLKRSEHAKDAITRYFEEVKALLPETGYFINKTDHLLFFKDKFNDSSALVDCFGDRGVLEDIALFNRDDVFYYFVSDDYIADKRHALDGVYIVKP